MQAGSHIVPSWVIRLVSGDPGSCVVTWPQQCVVTLVLGLIITGLRWRGQRAPSRHILSPPTPWGSPSYMQILGLRRTFCTFPQLLFASYELQILLDIIYHLFIISIYLPAALLVDASEIGVGSLGSMRTEFYLPFK